VAHAVSFSLHPEGSEEPPHLLFLSIFVCGIKRKALALRKSPFVFAFDFVFGIKRRGLSPTKIRIAFVFDFVFGIKHRALAPRKFAFAFVFDLAFGIKRRALALRHRAQSMGLQPRVLSSIATKIPKHPR
jgi:hypothetical protein